MNEDRSGFALGEEGDRSLESVVDERRSTKDKLLDRSKSSLDGPEVKDTSELVGSIFETKDEFSISCSMSSFLGTRGKKGALGVEWFNALDAEVVT